MCTLFSRTKTVFTLKSWKINKRNLLANTYFQKKCDLPNKSKLHILQLQLHGRAYYWALILIYELE